MIHYVYLLRQKTSSRYYIGIRSCSNAPELDDYFGSGTHIRLAVARYGQSAFEKTILCVCDTRDEAVELEIALVTLQEVDDPLCFNLQTGGICGKEVSKETRQKMSKAHKGKKFSPETCRRISEAKKGISPSTEHRVALSRALMGVPHPEWRKQAASKFWKGKKLSIEHRRKIGEANKGKRHSDETRRKISEANKGKRHSDETRRKMSESHKRRAQKRGAL